MICLIVILAAIALLCAWIAPGSGLGASAAQALDSSVFMISQFGRRSLGDDEEEEPPVVLRPAARSQVVSRTAAPNPAVKRKRVTPFQAKLVAAAQDWRCGCGCRDPYDPQRRGYQLDANFEIDHKIPTRWGGAHEASNWVAVLRAHHTIKSAIESSKDAQNRSRGIC